ncbi:MAG: hypothetical protein ACK5MU_02155 [Candidatus Saccharimonadales bacterium]
MENGKILTKFIRPQGPFTAEQFYNGMRRYAQVAYIMGMDTSFRDCHSLFMADYSPDCKYYELAGEFVFNEEGANCAAAKINHLIDNPDMKCTVTPQMGDIRYMWPGAIRIPHIGMGGELIIANSGVPDDMDVTLIAAFAIGLNELDIEWSLEHFSDNNQYAWALRKAARFIVIFEAIDTVCLGIEDPGYDKWIGEGYEIEEYSDILKAAYADFLA